MSGRHRVHSGGRAHADRRLGLRWLAGLVGLAIAALTVVAMQPAGANPATVDAQLSLSGVATQSSPAGGSVVGVHPGDSVTFSAATIPTAGLQLLKLDDLVNQVLGMLTCYQVEVDFSGLPGGKASTTLSNCNAFVTKSKTFTFPKTGTYDFTWKAQQVTLLGLLPINLDGNQLAAAGIKLNATNQYLGQVVVATDPPPGGISVQLPAVGVAPSLPVIGQLPKIGLPGITTPVIPVTVPGLSGVLGGSGGATGGIEGIHYTPPGLSVPEMVVPKGDGAIVGPDLNAAPNFSISAFGSPLRFIASTGSSTAAPAATASDQAPALPVAHPVSEQPVQIAASPLSPSGQMPVILAIAAIIVLSLVTATYARLYLLRKID